MVRIPSEYQEVEYIESTQGKQYINTGILIEDNLKFVLDFQPISKYSGSYIMGSYHNDDGTFYVYFGAAGKYQTAFGTAWKNTSLTYDTERHVFEYGFSDGVLTVIGDGQQILYVLDNKSPSYPILIAGTDLSTANKCRTYSAKMIKNGILLCNFIPCYHKSSGEIGMYDTVSKQFYTNSGTGTFLKGNDVTYDNINLLESRRRILLNTPHIETVSDTIASFKADIATKLKECKIHFTPIQEGEGDPSPDNVRPIHGWDGIEIYTGTYDLLSGINLQWNQGSCVVWNIGTVNSYISGLADACVTYIDVSQLRGKTLRLNHRPTGTAAGVAFYSEKNRSSYVTGISNSGVNTQGIWDIVVPSGDNINYMLFSASPNYRDNIILSVIATTLTIPFPQTIYGGYVDLIKGEVVEEYRKLEIAGASGGNNGSIYNGTIGTNRYFSLSQTTGKSYNNAFDAWCDKAQKKNGSGNAVWANPNNFIWCFTLNAGNQLHIVFDNETVGITQETSTTERTQKIKEWLVENHMTFILPLATPNTYSIDPQTLKVLRGMNNIWSDANGNIEVSFYTH